MTKRAFRERHTPERSGFPGKFSDPFPRFSTPRSSQSNLPTLFTPSAGPLARTNEGSLYLAPNTPALNPSTRALSISQLRFSYIVKRVVKCQCSTLFFCYEYFFVLFAFDPFVKCNLIWADGIF